MDHPIKPFSLLSYCPGMRGLEAGLELAIGRTNALAYVEIEAFIIENLVRQMEMGVLAPAPVWSNLKTFLPVARRLRGKVDILTGGYPCQPFSNAGLRLGTKDPRHLWPFLAEQIDAIRPICCFLENVPNHLNIGYREVRDRLEGLGYTVEEGIFSAEEVGAPHLRKRLFILAVGNAHVDAYRQEREHDGQSSFLSQVKRAVIGTAVSGGAGEAVDNADRNRLKQEYKIPNDTGQYVVADCNSDGEQQPKGTIQQIGQRPADHGTHLANTDSLHRRKQQQLEGSYGDETWDEPAGSGDVADTSGKGLQRGHISQGITWPSRRGGMPPTRRGAEFPSGPGQPQHAWEPPRTIESRLGYMLNGYSFREDLLRMAGNAVVPQAAEKAFRTLIQKFG